MKIAIPMNNDHIAGHFTKAQSLLMCDDTGAQLEQLANPALDANCSGKQSLLDLLASHQIQRVVVRNIGERMLGKLLEQGFEVHNLSRGRADLAQIIDEAVQRPNLLTRADQGQESVNYHKKQAEGGGCCSHEHGHAHRDANCHERAHAQGGRCCEQQSTSAGLVGTLNVGQRRGCCRA